MDDIMKYLPIALIVIMVIYLLVKLKGKSGLAPGLNREGVYFVFIDSWGKTEDGLLEVSGYLGEKPIKVGDIFHIVDKHDTVLDENVVVEKIDLGSVKSKYVNEAQPGEYVTLFLKIHCDTIKGTAYLKK